MESLETMRDHWWWRPGWRPGRSFYTWHITFDKHLNMVSLIDHYAEAVRRFPTLDEVGWSGLHTTIQGVGFSDEVSKSAVDNITEAARPYCASIEPFTITVGPARVDPETVQMPALPVEPIVQLRQAIRKGIAAVWGDDNVPEEIEGFQPHVTLAYSNGPGSIGDIQSALDEVGPQTAIIAVSAISLIDLNRDRKRYEWHEIVRLPLGSEDAPRL